MRIAVILLTCIGLAVPGAHGIALCIGCDGSVVLENAIDGACAGSQSRSCCARTSCEEDSATPQGGIKANVQHGSCHDVLLGRDAAPPSGKLSVKRRPSRSDSGAIVDVDPAAGLIEQPNAEMRSACSHQGAPVPPFLSTVVLRL